jgi:hypothetical protein
MLHRCRFEALPGPAGAGLEMSAGPEGKARHREAGAGEHLRVIMIIFSRAALCRALITARTADAGFGNAAAIGG